MTPAATPVADAPGSPVPAERPLLSVLIPVYNEERTVEALLRRWPMGRTPARK